MTFEEIIQKAIPRALGLPSDPIHDDVLEVALEACNEEGLNIWDIWPWDNKKPEGTVSVTPDSSGIITFDSTVDIVRALRALDSTGEDSDAILPQNDGDAFLRGTNVSSLRFINLSDDSDGYRRIQVDDDDSITTYRALVFKKWTDAVEDAAYDSSDPTATPTDYRVLAFPVDKAINAMIGYVRDALRDWDGQGQTTEGADKLAVVISKHKRQEGRTQTVMPVSPMFDDSGSAGFEK